MPLKLYLKKRNFNKTPEPRGNEKYAVSEHRFVVQKHAASHLHYDFRLEINKVLKSWAVPKGPSLDPQVKRLAVHVEDHPLSYVSFEGTIPKGEYGGGTVMLWDEGKWQSDGSLEKEYKKGNMTFTLKGKKLKGAWKLIQIKNDPKNWLLMKIEDSESHSASEFDILEKLPLSVKTGKTIDEIAGGLKELTKMKKITEVKAAKIPKLISKKSIISSLTNAKKAKLPNYIHPQLASLVDKPPAGKQWLHEIKFDGYRIISIVNQDKIKLITRNQNDWTDKLEFIVDALKKLKLNNTILDGELVALDDQARPNFQLLQNTLHKEAHAPLFYYAFDIIFYDGYDLSDTPLLERKKILEHLINKNNQSVIQYSQHQIGNGQSVFDEAYKSGLEGIVSKEIYSPYIQSRTKQWAKIKCVKRQEFIVVGYTAPQGTRSYFGSLLLGVYTAKNDLVYCGHVGTGFTETSLHTMYKLLRANETKMMPFAKSPPKISNVIWVKPKIIVEVEFIEWTKEGILRAPSFKGIRTDKPASQITREAPVLLDNNNASLSPSKSKTKKLSSSKRNIKLVENNLVNYSFSHPERILFSDPDITKAELAKFYQNISKWILPHIINRPLTLVRCPQGILKKCFYQKHIQEKLPEGIYTIDIKEKEGKDSYLYIKDIKGLMGLVQMGVLEIHPWGCHIDQLEKPDLITFDLDPAPDVKWQKVIEAAYLIKEKLEAIKLKSFVKTSGGKGLHVVLPITPSKSWAEIKDFSHAFVNVIVELNPKDYIGSMSKAKRTGKIFIDYLRNGRGATSVAAYSTRAKPSAPVSTPLDWAELPSKITSTSYNLLNLEQRLSKLKHDPWLEFFKLKQHIQLK